MIHLVLNPKLSAFGISAHVPKGLHAPKGLADAPHLNQRGVRPAFPALHASAHALLRQRGDLLDVVLVHESARRVDHQPAESTEARLDKVHNGQIADEVGLSTNILSLFSMILTNQF